MESDLEKEYPRIIDNVIAFWGTQMFDEYMEYLLIMDREFREGFPYTVMSDLMMLSEVHDLRMNRVRKIDELV